MNIPLQFRLGIKLFDPYFSIRRHDRNLDYMSSCKQIRAAIDYLSTGAACGLGGVLVIGLPGLFVSGLLFAVQCYLRQKGFPLPEFSYGFWKLVPSSAKQLMTVVSIAIFPLAFGFVSGWFVGMYDEDGNPVRIPPSYRSL